MLKDQILNIINGERKKGKTDEQIKVYLIGLGFNLSDTEQFIQKGNNPNLTYRKDTAKESRERKNHYLAPVIFFIIITSLGFFTDLAPNPLGSRYFVISILIISITCTLIFALISFIIRKISARFGKFWEIILWVLVLTTLAIVIWY
jgi:hypothetical protein